MLAENTNRTDRTDRTDKTDRSVNSDSSIHFPPLLSSSKPPVVSFHSSHEMYRGSKLNHLTPLIEFNYGKHKQTNKFTYSHLKLKKKQQHHQTKILEK